MPAPVSGNAATSLARWMPLCMCLDVPLRPLSSRLTGTMPLDFIPDGGNAMARSVARDMRIFTPARSYLLAILIKRRLPPGNTGLGDVNDGCAGDLQHYR